MSEISDAESEALARHVEQAVAERVAALLPTTYYSDRNVEWRLARLVEDWRNATAIVGKEIELSPCGIPGHTMATCVPEEQATSPDAVDNIPGHCLRCDEIAERTRELRDYIERKSRQDHLDEHFTRAWEDCDSPHCIEARALLAGEGGKK